MQGVELSSQEKCCLQERERSRKTNKRKRIRGRKSNDCLRVALFRAKHGEIVGNILAKQKIQNEWITIENPETSDTPQEMIMILK